MSAPLTILVGPSQRIVRVSDEAAAAIEAGEPVVLNGVTYRATRVKAPKADTPAGEGDDEHS